MQISLRYDSLYNNKIGRLHIINVILFTENTANALVAPPLTGNRASKLTIQFGVRVRIQFMPTGWTICS
jgi:hypothetical protein